MRGKLRIQLSRPSCEWSHIWGACCGCRAPRHHPAWSFDSQRLSQCRWSPPPLSPGCRRSLHTNELLSILGLSQRSARDGGPIGSAVRGQMEQLAYAICHCNPEPMLRADLQMESSSRLLVDRCHWFSGRTLPSKSAQGCRRQPSHLQCKFPLKVSMSDHPMVQMHWECCSTTWTTARHQTFLEDPQQVVPGRHMEAWRHHRHRARC